jgi:hypothetical protein
MCRTTTPNGQRGERVRFGARGASLIGLLGACVLWEATTAVLRFFGSLLCSQKRC